MKLFKGYYSKNYLSCKSTNEASGLNKFFSAKIKSIEEANEFAEKLKQIQEKNSDLPKRPNPLNQTRKYFQKYYNLDPKIETDFVDKNPYIIKYGMSHVLKSNYHKDPRPVSIRIPETEEEYLAKFKKEPKMSNKGDLKREHFDDYLVVGAEVFRNLVGDMAYATHNTDFKTGISNYPLDDFTQGFNVNIPEQSKKEIFGPIKYNYYFHTQPDDVDPHYAKYKKFYDSTKYIDESSPELKPIFVPSYKEEREIYNPFKVLKSELIGNDREVHNQLLLDRLSTVSSAYNTKIDVKDPEIESIFQQFRKIYEDSKKLFEYPKKPEFMFSNVTLNRCMEDGNYYDVKENFSPENCLLFNSLCEKIFLLFEKTDPNMLGDIVLKMFFEINLNVKPLWSKLEEVVCNNIQHMSLNSLCKIYLVACITSPKFNSPNFRKILKKEILSMLDSKSPEGYVTALVSMKFSNDADSYAEICNKCIKYFPEWLEKAIKNSQQTKNKNQNFDCSKSPESLVSSLAFAFGFGRPGKINMREKLDRADEFEDIFLELIDPISNFIPTMNKKQLLITLHAVAKSNVKNATDLIAYKTEKNVLPQLRKNANAFTIQELAEIITALNYMSNGNGSEILCMKLLENIIKQDLSLLTNDQFCEVIYLSSSRRLDSDINGKLDESRQKVITPIIDKLNQELKKRASTLSSYRQLSRVFSHLMYIRNQDVKLIDELLEACDKINGRLPIQFYRSFKYFDFYLRNYGNLPKTYNYEKLFSFRDRFYYSENLTNVAKEEDGFKKEIRNAEIYHMLKIRLRYFPVCCLPFNNMFLNHFNIETRKICFNIYYENDYIPNTKKLHPRILLQEEFVKTRNEWEHVFFSWDEYLSLGNTHQREEKIYKIIEELTEKQVKKGVIDRNFKFL